MTQAGKTMYGLLLVVGALSLLTVVTCSSQEPTDSPEVSEPTTAAPSTLGDTAASTATPTSGASPRPSSPTSEQLDEHERQLNTTDLQITKVDSVDPAVTGGNLVYTLTVTNNGPNPTTDMRVVDTLPAGVSYVGDAAGCVEDPVGTLTCDLVGLLAGDSKQITITALIGAVPGSITNVATVENLAGRDPVSLNDAASEETRVDRP